MSLLKRLKEIRDLLNTDDYQPSLEKQFEVNTKNRNKSVLETLKQIKEQLEEN